MSKLKILIISHMFPRKNLTMYGIFICRQANYLKQFGIRCDFVVPRAYAPWPLYYFRKYQDCGPKSDPIPPFRLSAKGARYVRLPGKWFYKYAGKSMFISIRAICCQLHDKNHYDAVLGVSMIPDAQAAILIGNALNLPIINLAIGSDIKVYPENSPELKKVLKDTLLKTNRIFGVSHDICNSMRLLVNNQINPQCVYLGRDEKAFSANLDKEKLRKDYGIVPNEVVAIFVGRISLNKGVSELIASVKQLYKEKIIFRLICVGDGPMRKDLQVFKESLDDQDKIFLPGHVSPEEVVRFLNISDFMIFPSYSEGMPQAILEAMNCGLPVIASNVGGIPEAVIENKTGLLIEPKDVFSLKNAIKELVINREKRKAMSKQAIEFANFKFDALKNAKLMAQEIYKTINKEMS